NINETRATSQPAVDFCGLLSPCPFISNPPGKKCRAGILPNAEKPLEFSRKGLLYYNSSSYSF
ncbi:TPA: hypothetical protein ACNCGM_004409, partial [Escherichia coli]